MNTCDEDEMLEGYLDGSKSNLDEFPKGSNRSDSYRHGWLNGRDDRLGRPRAEAKTLRRQADEIRDREASAL